MKTNVELKQDVITELNREQLVTAEVTNGLIIVWTNKLLSTQPYIVIEIGCSEAKECIHLIMRPLVSSLLFVLLLLKDGIICRGGFRTLPPFFARHFI